MYRVIRVLPILPTPVPPRGPTLASRIGFARSLHYATQSLNCHNYRACMGRVRLPAAASADEFVVFSSTLENSRAANVVINSARVQQEVAAVVETHVKEMFHGRTVRKLTSPHNHDESHCYILRIFDSQCNFETQ